MVIGFLFGCASALLFKHIDIRHSVYEMGVYLLLAYIPSLFSAVRLFSLGGVFIDVSAEEMPAYAYVRGSSPSLVQPTLTCH